MAIPAKVLKAVAADLAPGEAPVAGIRAFFPGPWRVVFLIDVIVTAVAIVMVWTPVFVAGLALILITSWLGDVWARGRTPAGTGACLLAATDRRLLLYPASALTGRARPLALSVPLTAVTGVDIGPKLILTNRRMTMHFTDRPDLRVIAVWISKPDEFVAAVRRPTAA